VTVVQPAATPSVERAPEAGVQEPSRFTAYATGCTAEPAGVVDRMLRPVERLLVPELSRISRRRVSGSRSRS
jgi:hypothetical protein